MALPPDAVERFDREGYLVLHGFFRMDELKPVIIEASRIVDAIARRLHAAGEVARLYENEGFYTRLARLEGERPGAAALAGAGGAPGPELASFAASPRLLEAARALSGGGPPRSFAARLRGEPPGTSGRSWGSELADSAWGPELETAPGALAPLIDLDSDSGVVEVRRRESPLDEAIALDLRVGSLLFLSRSMTWRIGENRSRKVRWSAELRPQ